MYDIKQLEDEWKRYRKKKLKPWYIGSAIFMVLILSIFLFQTNDKIDLSGMKRYFDTTKETEPLEDKVMSQETTSLNEKKVIKSVLIDDALETLEIKETMIEMSEKVVKEDPNVLVDIPILDETEESPTQVFSEGRKKIDLEVIDSASVSAYKDVEKRFFESHDIDDALFLARSYYKNGDYEKSEYWALQTNKLDEEQEESLLIFVKSKAKLGRKNEALSILSSYVKQSNSKEAQKLLYRIENDKL